MTATFYRPPSNAGQYMSQTATHREVANRGLLVVSVMLATLMQALDTTIANVALPNMQGSLSATQDQISWVLTSYIVAAAIATPATGWLASVLGRRRLLLIAIGGFTLASVLCGIASDISQMELFGRLQGLFGAALVPVSQSTLLGVVASLPTDDTKATRFDWRGFGFLSVGIGALQLFLDRGELKDWFSSTE